MTSRIDPFFLVFFFYNNQYMRGTRFAYIFSTIKRIKMIIKKIQYFWCSSVPPKIQTNLQSTVPVVRTTTATRLVQGLCILLLLLYIAQCLIDDLSQNVWLTMFFQPRQHTAGQFGKIVHGQQFEGVEHLIDDGLKLKQKSSACQLSSIPFHVSGSSSTYHFKFDIVTDSCLL